MLALAIFRVLRQVFKGSKAAGRIAGVLDKGSHPRLYKCYSAAAIIIYMTHIVINLAHGFQVESGVTAAATTVELIGHLMGA